MSHVKAYVQNSTKRGMRSDVHFYSDQTLIFISKELVARNRNILVHGLLTKHVRSRSLDIGQAPFFVFMDQDRVEVHKHAKRTRPKSSHLDRTSLTDK